MIPNACFQWNIANMVIALIAFLTRDWQRFFVFLNLVTSPIIIAFMLFHESPRWLVAKGKMSEACNVRIVFALRCSFKLFQVLNDLADKRWNGTDVVFTPASLESIRHEKHNKFYNFYHLFNHRRFAKQSLMQLLSMFTYSMVAMAYLYVIRDFSGSSVLVRKHLNHYASE